jgi:ABC-type bacteriocin/lantibiotic exporter with double-glycine peptidase domain
MNEEIQKTDDAKDIINELNQKRKEAIAKIENQLQEATQLYSTLLGTINTYSENDRKLCQDVYNKMFEIVNTTEKRGPGMLEALNSATKNMLDSTQRLRELLQEVGKTKTKLEEIQSIMNEPDEDMDDGSEFNMAEHI